jgi:cytochrome c oxidase assembly factor CtaG
MSLEPGVLAPVGLAAVWYAWGIRRRPLRVVGSRRRPGAFWRPAAFYGSLLTILVALVPLDEPADELFWAHMVQHVLLMLVAAPLLVLGAPLLPFWRPLPLGLRRAVAGALVTSPRLRPLRVAARAVAHPITAWLLFSGDLALWHVPWLYDLTLSRPPVHYTEHASFIAFGMLFWAQVIDSPPFHCRLDHMQRAIYVTAGAAASWVLAVVLALAPSPLYGAYASKQSRPGGISALADQQLAGGVMWGPGSITYSLIVFWAIYRWLDDDESKHGRRPSRRVAASL